MNERQKIIRRVTFIGAVLDGLLAFVKILVGWLVKSPALIADGLHSLSDLLTDVAVVLFSHWAQLAPDEDHPYGHHRYETVGTVILGTSLIVIASFIAWDSLLSLFQGVHLPKASFWAIIVAVISILSKEWIFRYTLKAAKKVNSRLMEANAWHSRSDAFSSIVVLVGVLATWFGYAWIELLAAIGVAILIGKMGVTLTWNATQDLVDRGVDAKLAKSIDDTIRETSGVVDVHMLRSRMMGNHIYLDVHIQVLPQISVSEGHYVAECVMQKVNDEYDQVNDITVHVDYEEDLDDQSELMDILPDRIQIEQLLSDNQIEFDRLQIHYRGHSVILELYFETQLYELDALHEKLDTLRQQHKWLKDYQLFFAR